MFSRNPLVMALALVGVGLATAVSIRASTNAKHTMYVTFNRPVLLPGVTLKAGSYIFEAPDDVADHDVVRIFSRDRSNVILTTFTRAVDRPSGMKRNQVFSFGEAAGTGAQPITVWWPEDSVGHQWAYRDKSVHWCPPHFSLRARTGGSACSVIVPPPKF
jgi:hypothetical protein